MKTPLLLTEMPNQSDIECKSGLDFKASLAAYDLFAFGARGYS